MFCTHFEFALARLFPVPLPHADSYMGMLQLPKVTRVLQPKWAGGGALPDSFQTIFVPILQFLRFPEQR